MGTVRYTTIAGEIMSENRNGVIRDYLPDSLGSTVGLLDSTQSITDTFEYWPYGEVRTRTGTTATPLKFVGTQGYFTDSLSKIYVRSRTMDAQKGRWLTKYPIGFNGGDLNLYRYVRNIVTGFIDPDGLQEIIFPIDTIGLRPTPIIQPEPITLPLRPILPGPPLTPPVLPPLMPYCPPQNARQQRMRRPIGRDRTRNRPGLPEPRNAPRWRSNLCWDFCANNMNEIFHYMEENQYDCFRRIPSSKWQECTSKCWARCSSRPHYQRMTTVWENFSGCSAENLGAQYCNWA